MKLAREFGHVCWRSMLASISAETVLEWQSFFIYEGYQADMDNWRYAMTNASNWNVTAMSAGIKLDNPSVPSDFLPSKEPPKEFNDDELMALGAEAGGMRFDPDC